VVSLPEIAVAEKDCPSKTTSILDSTTTKTTD